MTLDKVPMALLALVCLLLSGCLGSFEQESDWRWKQYSPEYRSPWPQDKTAPGEHF
jgi:hypothetical protein